MIATLHGIASASRGLSRVITNNLVLHYNTFNPSSYVKGQGTTINDLSGNGLHGTIVGSPPWSTNYFSFSNDYITSANLAPSLTEVHTAELWVYPTGNGVLLQANAQATPNTSYHHSTIEIVAGKLEFGLWNGSGITSTGPTSTISFNQWHQVVLTYDGSIIRGYLDGSFAGSVNVTWDSPEDSTGVFYYNFGYRDTTSQGDGTDFDGRFGIMRIYSVAFSLQAIQQNYNAVTGNVSDLVSDTLRLYYDPSLSASYSSPSSLIYNLAPNTNTGTLSNVSANGTYLTFNGSSSQVSVPDSSILEPGSSNFTIEAWVRIHSFGSTMVIAGKFDNGGLAADVSYSLRVNASGVLRCEVGDGTGSLDSPLYQATTNTWYQVVGVIDNTNNQLKLYINGVSQGTPTTMSYTSILNSANNLYLGSYNNGEYSQYLDGDLGVVRVYQRALTDAEVLANYNYDRSKY
jgi:hypothetical protein